MSDEHSFGGLLLITHYSLLITDCSLLITSVRPGSSPCSPPDRSGQVVRERDPGTYVAVEILIKAFYIIN